MVRRFWTLSLAISASLGLAVAPATAQQTGGTLKFFHRDSPASMSIHEEATISTVAPMMGVFNNLVLFKQDEKQNRPEFIQPELAESWSWDEERTRLTFKLRQGVKWHDGKPFTAADVKCTWDMLLGKSQDKLRLNPRKAWYRNLEDVVAESDHAVTFVLKRSQPAFLMLLASGMSPVYPCHVNSRDMRTQPIGTGPFKFAAFKPNEFIRVVKNPDYWKPGRPYLDGIEWTIIPNRSTQTLAFIAGKFDMTFPYEVTLQSMRDIQKQAPNAICEMTPTPVAMNLLVNRDTAPFNDPDIRRAMQLTIDRNSFLDIIAEGQGDINGAMQSPPAGLWGLPPEILTTLPGYGPDVAAKRADLAQMQAKVSQSERDWARARNLKPTKALAEVDYDTAEATYRTAKSTLAVGEATIAQTKAALNSAQAAVAKAQATLADAQAALHNAEINLGYCRITAPFDGRMSRHLYDVGNLVGDGQATVLATIYKDNPMYAYVSVSESDLLRFRQMAREGRHKNYDRGDTITLELGLGN